jgi:hypothetical protein
VLIRNTSTRTIYLRDLAGNQYTIPAVSDTTLSDSLWSDTEFRRWIRYRIRDLVVTSATAGDALSNAPGTTAANTITASNTTTVPFTVRLASGSTLDLQDWLNSSGTTIAKLDFSGALTVQSITLTSATGAFLQRSVTTAATQVFGSRQTGDGNDRFSITAGGTLTWGPGTTSTDTTFARNATGGITASATTTLTGATADFSQKILAPTVNGAFTLTRLNYLEMDQFAGTSTVTDAAVIRFNAAAGTHKAVDAGTTKTTPGTVSAWVKVNINGTIHYMPAYTSKTS